MIESTMYLRLHANVNVSKLNVLGERFSLLLLIVLLLELSANNTTLLIRLFLFLFNKELAIFKNYWHPV